MKDNLKPHIGRRVILAKASPDKAFGILADKLDSKSWIVLITDSLDGRDFKIGRAHV